MPKEWAVGVTTVPERQSSLLRYTLGSLDRAGFPLPRLFVDGGFVGDVAWYARHYPDHAVTFRTPLIRVAGNWVLGLYELYYRQPRADLFAMFQDDILICRDAREYVENCPLWQIGRIYLNLATIDTPPARGNVKLSRQHPSQGWFKSNQLGCGALGLVFDNQGVRDLLASRHMADRPFSDIGRGWRGVDGGISETLCRSAQLRENKPYTEYCHKPSLIQHVGEFSTIDKRPDAIGHDPNFPRLRYGTHQGCVDWPGEQWSPLKGA